MSGGTLGTMVEIEEVREDQRSIVTPNFRLTFSWTGDRWSHFLEVAGRRAVQSVESIAGRDDVLASPAYQQLGFQREGERTHALLVGQSGSHHYSASFTVVDNAEGSVVEVDVADRCRNARETLACTYWVDATSSDLSDAGNERIAWQAIQGTRLTLESADPATRLTLAEAGRAATQVQAFDAAEAAGATRRCRYRWSGSKS